MSTTPRWQNVAEAEAVASDLRSVRLRALTALKTQRMVLPDDATYSDGRDERRFSACLACQFWSPVLAGSPGSNTVMGECRISPPAGVPMTPVGEPARFFPVTDSADFCGGQEPHTWSTGS